VRRLLSLTVIACTLGLAPAGSLATSSSILPGFRSPSGNIKCLYQPVAPAFLYCTIGTASYAKRLIAYCAAPRGVDWAGFTLGKKSKGSVACSGGTLYEPSTQHPRYVTLPYGKTWRHSVFTCTSHATGVTCRNPRSHGMFISRASYRVY
jgi:Family of unknown function (DUF6636)